MILDGGVHWWPHEALVAVSSTVQYASSGDLSPQRRYHAEHSGGLMPRKPVLPPFIVNNQLEGRVGFQSGESSKDQ